MGARGYLKIGCLLLMTFLPLGISIPQEDEALQTLLAGRCYLQNELASTTLAASSSFAERVEDGLLKDSECSTLLDNDGTQAYYNREWRRLLQKLKDQRCLTVMVLGGSVSAGFSGKNATTGENLYLSQNSWAHSLLEFIQQEFPCRSQQQGQQQQHALVNKARSAAGTESFLATFERDLVEGGEYLFDLVLVETSMNDGNRRQLENTEALIRLVATHQPEAALFYNDFFWRRRQQRNNGKDILGSRNAHQQVCRYYRIPQLDFYPLFRGCGLQHDDLLLESDAIHPSCAVQTVVGWEVGRFLKSNYDRWVASPQPEKMEDPAIIDIPFNFMNETEFHAKYSGTNVQSVDFTSKAWQRSVWVSEGHVRWSQGFESREDVKGKKGMIATEEGSVLTIDVPKRSSKLLLAYLKSYEHMGRFELCFDGDNCRTLDSLWNDRVSLAEHLDLDIPKGSQKLTIETLSCNGLENEAVRQPCKTKILFVKLYQPGGAAAQQWRPVVEETNGNGQQLFLFSRLSGIQIGGLGITLLLAGFLFSKKHIHNKRKGSCLAVTTGLLYCLLG